MNKLEDSSTGNTMYHSDSVIENNLDASIVSEVANTDEDLTSDARKNNEEDDNINIPEKRTRKLCYIKKL